MASAFGVIGLGRMGGGLAEQARSKGLSVVGYDALPDVARARHPELTVVPSLADLAELLAPPRVVLLYVPAGPPVDALLEALAGVLAPGDVIADGGNSYWGDSIRRHRRLLREGIHFADLGTSGGVEGARSGASFMLGAEEPARAQLEPLLRALSADGGYVHAGGPGAGHFVKLVHNGIEFGMLQAIGEGVELLAHFPSPLRTPEVLEAWRHGSVIRSWLLDLLVQEWNGRGGLDAVPSWVEDTGEVNWLLADATRFEVPVPVLAQAVMALFASRDRDPLCAKAIAVMRHGFGGHALGAVPAVEQERRTSQVDANLP